MQMCSVGKRCREHLLHFSGLECSLCAGMQRRTSSFGAMLSALTSVMGSGADAGSDTDRQLQPRRQRRRLQLPRPADVAVLDGCRLGPHRWGRLQLVMPPDVADAAWDTEARVVSLLMWLRWIASLK